MNSRSCVVEADCNVCHHVPACLRCLKRTVETLPCCASVFAGVRRCISINWLLTQLAVWSASHLRVQGPINRIILITNAFLRVCVRVSRTRGGLRWSLSYGSCLQRETERGRGREGDAAMERECETDLAPCTQHFH